jgi:hypothetical protein
MIRRAALTAVLAATFAIGSVAPALAAPGNGAGQATFPIRCGGRVLTFTIASGTWSAAYVRETGQRFIPKATYVSIVDAATGEVVFEEADVKPGAEKRSNVVCVDAAPDDGLIVTFAVHGRLT